MSFATHLRSRLPFPKLILISPAEHMWVSNLVKASDTNSFMEPGKIPKY